MTLERKEEFSTFFSLLITALYQPLFSLKIKHILSGFSGGRVAQD
jgi:hypothetical protein